MLENNGIENLVRIYIKFPTFSFEYYSKYEYDSNNFIVRSICFPSSTYGFYGSYFDDMIYPISKSKFLINCIQNEFIHGKYNNFLEDCKNKHLKYCLNYNNIFSNNDINTIKDYFLQNINYNVEYNYIGEYINHNSKNNKEIKRTYVY